jgi:hypothetical protein
VEQGEGDDDEDKQLELEQKKKVLQELVLKKKERQE